MLVTATAGAYLASVAWKGWIPFDDGMLAQAAQRVLEGQFPHRDYTDVYTGGLSFFHAAAFRIGGSSLATLRAVLLATMTLSIPAWYYVASRFTPPLIAGVVTLTAFVWSVPNYPAAMPSWYNLILAIAATAATLRYLDTRRGWWIMIAGLAGGFSVLIKIIGVYLIAALVLFFAYITTSPPRTQSAPADPASRAGKWIVLIVSMILAVAPFVLVRAALDLQAVVELAAPPAIIGSAVAWQIVVARRRGHLSVRAALTTWVALAAGVAIPLIIFAVVYWRAGALAPLVRGVFVSPQVRFASPRMHTPGGPPLSSYAFTLPILLGLTIRSTARPDKRVSVVVLAILAALALLSINDHRVMVAVWLSVRMLMLPVAAIVGVRLVREHEPDVGVRHREAMVLLCCVAAWCSLGQFPFSAPIYFSYIAPLVILATVAVAVESGRPSPSIGLPAVVGYAAFALAVRPQLFPRRPELSPLAQRIDLARGGIYVWPAERQQYTAVVSLLRQHSTAPWILALPDAPEVYFLSGYKNPMRAMYDVFEDTTNRSARLLRLADERQVSAIVINRDPQVSMPLDQSLVDSLAQRFSEHQLVGAFEVRWKNR